MEKKKLSKGKIAILAVIVFLIIGVISGIANNLTGQMPNDAGKTQKENTVKNAGDSNSDKTESTAEDGTSAKVDEILLQAKHDAENISEKDADAKWEEAFEYLKAHKDNFYENNEVMEQSMYFGEYIYRYIEANSPANNVSELQDSTRAAYDAGYNTVKAIKYVYRGAESQDSEGTVNALSKAKENLDKFK